MEQNKARTYLFYALGEVLLVVVGILIALQLNNWNESQKRIKQEKYLILELKKEFQENLILIDDDIQTNNAGLNGTLEFMKLLQDRELEKQRRKSDSLIVYLYYINTFEPNSGVIDDIITTGKLDLIRDDSLRKELANWAGRNVDLYDDIDIRNNYLFESLIPYVSKHYPMADLIDFYGDVALRSPAWKELKRTGESINLDGMYNKEMGSHLFNHAINHEYVISGSIIYRDYITSILNRIDAQIEDDQ